MYDSRGSDLPLTLFWSCDYNRVEHEISSYILLLNTENTINSQFFFSRLISSFNYLQVDFNACPCAGLLSLDGALYGKMNSGILAAGISKKNVQYYVTAKLISL